MKNVEEMLKRRKETCMRKYGVDHPMKCHLGKLNHQKAILEKYGVNHYSKTKAFSEKIDSFWTPEKRQETSDKIKKTCLEKYGVDNPFKLNLVKEKSKLTKIEKYNNPNYNNRSLAHSTCLQVYGVKHPMKNKDVQSIGVNKRTQSFIKTLFDGSRLNYELKPLFKPEDFLSVNDLYLFECNTCKTHFHSNIEDGKIPKCPACFSRNNISKPEIDFLNYLKIPNTIENRQKYIKPFKVDGMKNNKIFEFLGDYWHGNPKIFISEDINYSNKQSFGKLYENTTNKFIELFKKGYDIYYIWEHDWNMWNKNKSLIFPIRKYKENIKI